MENQENTTMDITENEEDIKINLRKGRPRVEKKPVVKKPKENIKYGRPKGVAMKYKVKRNNIEYNFTNMKDISDKFNVSISIIHKMVHNKSYKIDNFTVDKI
jgi:hypothetical protein